MKSPLFNNYLDYIVVIPNPSYLMEWVEPFQYNA